MPCPPTPPPLPGADVFMLSVSFFQKQRPKRVKAIYNCVADNPDELTFTEGEVIVVDGEEDQEWWVSVSPLPMFSLLLL